MDRMQAPDPNRPLKPGLARAANEMLGDLRQGEVRPDAPTVAAPLPDSATPPTSRADTGVMWRSRVPRSLGPYDLLEELGHGGMGVVYRARHMHLGTLRAVKVLIAGEHASVESIMRFQREAAAVARMGKHPNIVSVHDLGEERGIAWYAMEYVEGKSLRDRLKERAYRPEEAARLVEKVARALHYAHGHGIVHRDVKPENVVVREDGDPQVMDFGLARDVESNARISVVGAAMGTPNYMAPEQVEGRHQECDARTDVYSLGATLYEILTGAFAHPGHAVAQVFEHIRRGDIVPPRRLRPDVPRDLETICLKCLAPERARRYATAEALADDLARFVSGEPIMARRVGLAERAWKRMRRNRAVSALAVALLLTLFAALLWRPVSEWNAGRQAASEKARRLAVAREGVNRAQAALNRGAVEDARDLAEAVVKEFESTTSPDPDFPFPEAHAVIASVARLQLNRQEALLEAFRASRAAIGTRWEEACRLDLACQVCETGQFDLANDRFASARAEKGLVVSREEADTLRRVAELLASREEVPILPRVFCAGDVDGDGRDEVVAIGPGGAELKVLSYGRNGFDVTASTPIPLEIRKTVRGLDVMDVDGKAPSEILVAGQTESPERGLVQVLRSEDGQLRVVAEGALPGGTLDRPFAVADLDGDGTRELLVGLGAGAYRGIVVFSVDEASCRLTTRLSVETKADVWELFRRKREGRTEILAFLGAWGVCQVWALRFDLGAATATVEASIPGAKEYRLERRLAEQGKGPLLIGAQWTDDASRPLQEEMGKIEFGRNYLPPGIYEAPVSLSSAADIRAMPPTEEIPAVGEIDARPCLLWDAKGDFCWSMVVRDLGGESRTAIRIHELRNGEWTEIVGFDAGERWTMSPCSADLDGDGDSELLMRLGTSFQVIGTKRETADRGGKEDANPTRASLPWASRNLSIAQEAEALGLHDEAAKGYRIALSEASTLEEVSLGAQGFLRTQVAAGRLAEASNFLLERIAAAPTLRALLARLLLDAAEAAGEWRLALEAADALAIAPGLSITEHSGLAERRGRLARLADPRVAAELCRPGNPLPMLATSPLCARLGADGCIQFTWRAHGRDAIFFPLDCDKMGLRLSGRIQLDRFDWGANLELGVVQGDPWVFSREGWGEPDGGAPLPRPCAESLFTFIAFGETWSPNRVLDLLARESHGGGSRRMRSQVALAPGEPAGLPWMLEFAPHLETLFGRLEGPRGQDVASVSGVHLTDVRPYVRISGHGDVRKLDSWGRARIAGLTLFSAGGTTGPYEPEPRSAAELLFLANGRWIQGRTSDARHLYDAAIAAGDAWKAGQAALVAAGLPSTSRAGWTEGAIRWVPVDARFWRGLLRAEMEGVAAGLPDLDEAQRRDPGRVRDLIRRAALPLIDRPAATAALRALLEPETEPRDWKTAGETIVSEWGADVAEALLKDVGYGVQRHCRVEKALDPAREGDELVSFDGVDVNDFGVYRRTRGAALDGGKTSVPLVLVREGKRIEATIDPRDGIFDLEPVTHVIRASER